MHLEPRLDRLERVAPPRPECSACGYPVNAIMIHVVIDEAPKERCRRCGRRLTDTGVPLHHNATVILLTSPIPMPVLPVSATQNSPQSP